MVVCQSCWPITFPHDVSIGSWQFFEWQHYLFLGPNAPLVPKSQPTSLTFKHPPNILEVEFHIYAIYYLIYADFYWIKELWNLPKWFYSEPKTFLPRMPKKSHLKIFTLWFIYTTIKDIFIILVIIHNTPKVQLRAKNGCYIGCLVSILN